MRAREWISERKVSYRSSSSGPHDNTLALVEAIIDYLDESGPNPFVGGRSAGPRGPLEDTVYAVPAGANGPHEGFTGYTLSKLLKLGRDIWGPEKLELVDVMVRLGVDYGKLARLVRRATKDHSATYRTDLETCFGNIIFSMIRWADSVGLDVSLCIDHAIAAQTKFAAENPER